MSEHKKRLLEMPAIGIASPDIQALLDEIEREPIPDRLIVLAERLQAALQKRRNDGKA